MSSSPESRSSCDRATTSAVRCPASGRSDGSRRAAGLPCRSQPACRRPDAARRCSGRGSRDGGCSSCVRWRDTSRVVTAKSASKQADVDHQRGRPDGSVCSPVPADRRRLVTAGEAREHRARSGAAAAIGAAVDRRPRSAARAPRRHRALPSRRPRRPHLPRRPGLAARGRAERQPARVGRRQPRQGARRRAGRRWR